MSACSHLLPPVIIVGLLRGHQTKMADPLTLTAAVLAVVQLANSSGKIIRSLANASKSLKDDRYDELYWRMYAEKQSLIALLTNIETSGRPLSPENIKTFRDLLGQLTTYHTTMEDALRRLLPQGGGFTLRTVANRLKFDSGGFQELKQRMNSIEAMTRALKLLGETLPRYSPRPMEQRPTTTTDSQVSSATEHPSMDRTVPEAGGELQDAPPLEQDTGSREVPLATLCRLCDEAMVELSLHPMLRGKGTCMAELSARFQLWSLGVWGSQDGLMDRILEADPERHDVVGMFVTKSLVNIAIALESIFRAIQNAEVRSVEQPLPRSRLALLAALGTGNLVDIAVQRWTVLSMSFDDEDEPTAPETAMADADNSGSKTAMRSSAMTVKATDAAIGSALEDIECSLESLFSINSSIRSIRRSYRLDMESAWEDGPNAMGSTVGVDAGAGTSGEQAVEAGKQKEHQVLQVVSKDKAAQKLMRAETVQLVKRLEDALNSDETSVSDTAGSGAVKNMRLLSPAVKAQRLKLEEFEKQSVEMPPDKLKLAVNLNQTMKKTVDSVIVSDSGDAFGKSKPLPAAWETDQILDWTLVILRDAATSITQ